MAFNKHNELQTVVDFKVTSLTDLRPVEVVSSKIKCAVNPAIAGDTALRRWADIYA